MTDDVTNGTRDDLAIAVEAGLAVEKLVNVMLTHCHAETPGHIAMLMQKFAEGTLNLRVRLDLTSGGLSGFQLLTVDEKGDEKHLSRAHFFDAPSDGGVVH